jgi:uncharacterized protein YegP (UPF0339 family)
MRTHKTWTKNFGKIELYKDEKKEWRWRVVAQNGRTLSVSSEGYKRLGDAKRCAQSSGSILTHINWIDCEVT